MSTTRLLLVLALAACGGSTSAPAPSTTTSAIVDAGDADDGGACFVGADVARCTCARRVNWVDSEMHEHCCCL